MIFVLARMAGFEGALNLFRYITFRSGAAVMTALVIALVVRASRSGPTAQRRTC
jgi:phospho-N-acetylmuramoyl-pentapeptide-transferase